MTWAIHIENTGMQAARYDAETEASEFVGFPNGRTTLSTRFRVSQRRQILPIALSEAETTGSGTDNIVVLNVQHDGMTLEITGDVEGITTEDLFVVICKTVLATETAAAETDRDVVFLGTENPVFRQAAVRAGFQEVGFLLPSDAAVRQWQHSREGESTPTHVLLLTCNTETGSVAWEARVADDHGFLVPDDAPSNTDSFVPASTMMDVEASLENGLTRFFDWAQRHQGSRNLVLTGGRTQVVKEFISLVESYGYAVFCAEPLIGGAQPQIASRYQRCDAAIQAAIASLKAAEYFKAIECFKAAAALFDPPPENVQRLRVRLRQAVLAAASPAESPQEARQLYLEALSISQTDAEKAQVYVHLVGLYRKTGKRVEAEEAAIAASFLDADTQRECMIKLATYSGRTRLFDLVPQLLRMSN